MSGIEYGSVVRDCLIGVGVLLAGIGFFVAMVALARTLARVNVTLDGLDRQLDALGQPVAQTLNHVDGIADTADRTLARLSGAVDALERAAGNVSSASELICRALSPAIVNTGATLSGITAGLRRLVTGKKSTDQA